METDTRINDPSVQRVIDEANQGTAGERPSGPVLEDPPGTVFTLAAPYMQDNMLPSTEFEVRELTGRDEEALGRISDVGRSIIAMISRGTVRLGSDEATDERLDSLVAGDWDSLLIAIRAATFGSEVELKPTCTDCRSTYEVTVDITKDLKIRTANVEDLSWTVKGKKHVYEVDLYTGATQRKILELMSESDRTVASMNSEILHDSISTIDGLPVMGMDDVRDLPMKDRREILASIQERRVGPDLQGVTIKCPTCGNEQPHPLNAAALFQ
jgi:hypothetical protein